MRLSKIFRFTLGSRILAIKINVWNQELHTHYGITNETPDGYYVPFWDFIEDIPLEMIVAAIEESIIKFQLTESIYILQTYPKESYRALGFDMLEWKEYISILASTDLIDLSYLRHSVMRGRAVLRVTDKDGTKNKVIARIPGYDYVPERVLHSDNHRAFFSSLFKEINPPIPMPKRINVRLSKYESFR